VGAQVVNSNGRGLKCFGHRSQIGVVKAQFRDADRAVRPECEPPKVASLRVVEWRTKPASGLMGPATAMATVSPFAVLMPTLAARARKPIVKRKFSKTKPLVNRKYVMFSFPPRCSVSEDKAARGSVHARTLLRRTSPGTENFTSHNNNVDTIIERTRSTRIPLGRCRPRSSCFARSYL
jgi:hypothetical protein